MADEHSVPTAGDGAQHVIAVVFDKPTRADEALLAIVHLAQEGGVSVADAVVIAKMADGRTHIRQTVDVSPGRGAVGGAWWGVLVGLLFGGPIGAPIGGALGAGGGALYGKLVDVGLDDDWVKQMAEWLDSGTSGLLLLLDDVEVRDGLLRELARFEGRLATTTFPEPVRRAVEEELNRAR